MESEQLTCSSCGMPIEGDALHNALSDDCENALKSRIAELEGLLEEWTHRFIYRDPTLPERTEKALQEANSDGE